MSTCRGVHTTCEVVRRAPITERQFQAQVLELARLRGWFGYHTYDSRRSEPGFPDWVFIRDRVLFVELKTEKGRLTSPQARWADRLRAAGQAWYCWRPSMWEEIERVLE